MLMSPSGAARIHVKVGVSDDPAMDILDQMTDLVFHDPADREQVRVHLPEVACALSESTREIIASPQVVSAAVDVLLTCEGVAQIFSDTYLGGYPITTEGVRDFLTEVNGGRRDSAVDTAQKCRLVLVDPTYLYIPNSAHAERVYADRIPCDGTGLIAVTTPGLRVVDGYHRIAGLSIDVDQVLVLMLD